MKRALVISLICVLGLAFTGLAATLSGSWDTDVTIDPQQTNFNDAIGLESVITVDYTVGDWTFTSVTVLTELGWTDQDFSVAGVLGAFSLTSALDFDPVTPLFGSWNTTADISIAGVELGADFTLAGGSVDLDISVAGVAGDVSVGVVVSFGDAAVGCDLDWQGIVIDLGFPFCCADISATIEFDCSGFESICFEAGGIAVPNMPYLTLSAEVCFTMEGKTLTLTPSYDFGDTVCFDIDFDVLWTDLSIQNIAISGIGLECTIGGVTFTGYSYLIMPETETYWEYYIIETTDDGCCGPFDFSLGFYFLENGLRLFDIALIDVDMSLQVASQFSFNMGLEVDVNSGAFTLWTVGFEVTW
ncbi:hypothetical protein ACFLSW_01845 [Candidatus Bipolaricaulota bacterium]